jgi:hypothetical protein
VLACASTALSAISICLKTGTANVYIGLVMVVPW